MKRWSLGPTLLLLSQICILQDSKAGGRYPAHQLVNSKVQNQHLDGKQSSIKPRCREVAATAGTGLTQSRSLYLIAIDKATWVKARPSGGQRGVMWASEVRPLALGL